MTKLQIKAQIRRVKQTVERLESLVECADGQFIEQQTYDEYVFLSQVANALLQDHKQKMEKTNDN